MLFKDVIGQEDVKQHLLDMVQQNRLSHALLFLGKEGSGALPLAMAFAQYVSLLPSSLKSNAPAEPSLFGEVAATIEVKLPATPHAADEWMQKQASFQMANGMVHPDIHYSYPVISSKPGERPISTNYAAEWREFFLSYPYGNVYDWLQFINAENKQGNITAEECNDIIKKLSLKSFESSYKILIMWMPEYLGKEGNKLLKLIEEPPPDTIFILVTENENNILDTIISRTQLIKVPALQVSEVADALTQRNGCAADKAQQVSSLSEGNYREALHLLQHADEDFHALLKDWLNTTLKYQPAAQVKLFDELAKMGREKQKQFLKYFTHLLEHALRLQVLAGAAQEAFAAALPSGEKDFIERLNKVMAIEQLEAVSEELDKATYYIERNANAKMLFHALTIKIFHIVKNRAIIEV